MKKVEIKKFTAPDMNSVFINERKYLVQLGNGLNVLFSSRKKVDRFLSETNKFLTARMFDLNEILIDLIIIERRTWYYHKHSGEMLQVRNYINNVMKSLDMITERSGWENGNYFVFKHFQNSIKILIECSVILQQVYQQRNHYPEKYALQSTARRLRDLRKLIELYGFNSYDHVPGDQLLRFRK